MSRKWILSGIVGVVFVLAACTAGGPTATPEPTATPVPAPFDLTLLYTNDGWGYTEPCACDPSAGGLARRAAYTAAVRAEAENVIVVDAGDSLLSLQHVGNREQGLALADAYNQMGYDAINLGGMDFRMGLDVLREQIQVAEYAVLSANTLDPQTKDVFDRGYVILERAGRRIGLIGLTDPKVTQQVTQGEVLITEPVETLVALSTTIADQIDVLVVVSHLGMVYDMNLDQLVPEIDVVVSGLDKEVYDPPLTAAGPLIVSAGSRGEFIGRVDLHFDADAVLTSFESHMQWLTDEVPDDPDMRNWMAQSGLMPASALTSGSEGKLSR
ncbi:MAG: hypothetical protein JXA09_17165 [Anaerolineae bacterium]|nr:hypothetical protein [Anaerolineae bacterium]